MRKIQAFGREFDLVVERHNDKLRIIVSGEGVERQEHTVAAGETVAIQFASK